MERDRRRSARLTGSVRRLLSLAVLCTVSTWWLAAAIARADTPPSNDGAPPTISGTAQQGDVLTASPGGWSGDGLIQFSYAWSDGQSGPTITLPAADVGKSLTVTVTASNDFGQGSATSDSYGPVLPLAPVPGNPPPTISGTAQQGDTLSVTNGAWSNDPTAFAYVWEDCDASGKNCAPITGAASSSYTLQASDVGDTIVAQVTASNLGGGNSAMSSPTASVLPPPPQIGTAPGISGIAQQGRTLNVSTGAWSNNPNQFAYVWRDCDSAGVTCSAIPGATSSSYTVQASDVGQYLSVKVTASNPGGQASVITASVGPVLPPPPANAKPPVISAKGATLSVGGGSWDNATTYAYTWESCNASGGNCTAIGGATSSSYALSGADIGRTIACVVTATGPGGSTAVTTAKTAVVVASQIPPASQPTTTGLLTTPGAPVTNQSVTLIATVTAGTSSTALWGTVTFENGGAPIPGCANMAAVPSGRSATVACSTSFAASSPRLSAAFTPASGSILSGSSSPAAGLTVGPDASVTTLTAAPSITVGTSITYTAAVAPPAPRPGPVQPTGSVEFLDGSTPIGSCTSQPLSGGAASCTVSYPAAGAHQISARYSGDGNFTGSSSPVDQVSAVPAPTSVLGTITATMQWAFYFTPRYTVVRDLIVNGASPGARVVVNCRGRGCPFASRATVLTRGKRCGRKAKRSCGTPGRLDLTAGFARRHLTPGTRITIRIVRPNWIGKTYRFTVRPRRGPRVQIGTLPAG